MLNKEEATKISREPDLILDKYSILTHPLSFISAGFERFLPGTNCAKHVICEDNKNKTYYWSVCIHFFDLSTFNKIENNRKTCHTRTLT